MKIFSAAEKIVLAGSVCAFAFLYFLGGRYLFFAWDEITKYEAVMLAAGVFGDKAPVSTCFLFPILLMLNDYVGGISALAALPWVLLTHKILGAFVAFKAFTFFWGAATFVSVFFVVRCLFGAAAAGLCVFFFATNTVYINHIRMAFMREEIPQVLGLWTGVALCLLSGRRGGDRRWLLLAFLVFGLTLWAKIMFVGYMFALCAGLLAMGRERKALLGFLRRAGLPGLAVFTVGASPLIYFNLRYKFATFQVLLGKMWADMNPGPAEVAGEQWNNTNIFGNLLSRFNDVHHFLSGNMVDDPVFGYNFLFVGLFACALCWAALKAFGVVGADSRERGLLRFLLGAYACLLFLTCFVPETHNSEHILVMCPFFEMLSAVFVLRCLAFLPRVRWRQLGVALLCLAWLWVQYPNIGERFEGRQGYDPSGGMHVYEVSNLTPLLERSGARNLVASHEVGTMLRLTQCGLERIHDFDSILNPKSGIRDLSSFKAKMGVPPDEDIHVLLFSYATLQPERKEMDAWLDARGMRAEPVARKCFLEWSQRLCEIFRLVPDGA